MQNHKSSSSRVRFHAANLAPNTGVALVRYNEADELLLCAGAVCRLRKSASQEAVFEIQPSTLADASVGVDVQPAVTVLPADHYGRIRTRITDQPEYTRLVEEHTPNGVWAVLVFGRGKTRPQFEVTRLELDQSSWNAKFHDDGAAVGSRFSFAASAAVWAGQVPSAFHLLKTMAFVIGGVDCDCFPPTKLAPAEELLSLQVREREFRNSRQRNRHGGKQTIAQVRNQLSPEQRALLDQLVQETRAAKAAGVQK